MTILDKTFCPYCNNYTNNHAHDCVTHRLVQPTSPSLLAAQLNVAEKEFLSASGELSTALAKFNTAKTRMELILSTWRNSFK